MEPADEQRILDEEHLRLLRIGYFIAGGTSLFAGVIGAVYLGIGFFFSAMISNTMEFEGDAEFVPVIFMAIGGFLLLVVGGLALIQFLAAKSLGEHRNRTLCLIAAGITCLSMPWGTALGVASFYVLGRNSVRDLFEGVPTPPEPLAPGEIPPPPSRR